MNIQELANMAIQSQKSNDLGSLLCTFLSVWDELRDNDYFKKHGYSQEETLNHPIVKVYANKIASLTGANQNDIYIAYQQVLNLSKGT